MQELLKPIGEKALCDLAKMLITTGKAKEYRFIEINLKTIVYMDPKGITILTLNAQELGIEGIKAMIPGFTRMVITKDETNLILFDSNQSHELIQINKYDGQDQ